MAVARWPCCCRAWSRPCRSSRRCKESIQQSPTQQARALYYDTLVFDPYALRHLVQTFGASQLMIGTDYPFNFHERQPVERIRAAGFDDSVVAQLVHANARRFLGLHPISQGTQP